MNDKNIEKIIRKILLEEVNQELVQTIIDKLEEASSEMSITFGGGTDEDNYLKAIQMIPDAEVAEAIDTQYDLVNSIDEEFNFDDEDDWNYVLQIYKHLTSLGVKVINGEDQEKFYFDFPSNTEQDNSTDDNSQESGGDKQDDKSKEQENIIKKGLCKPAPSLESICNGTSYLKNCMKGTKGSSTDVVYLVQDFLIDNGFRKVSKTETIDWIYGPLTTEMVRQYQLSVSIKADGLAGKQTLTKMGICKTTGTPGQSDNGNTIITPQLPQGKDDSETSTNPETIVNDKGDAIEHYCQPSDKKVVDAYNKIMGNINSDDATFLRRECKILLDYQISETEHCDDLERAICFCGKRASSGKDGYAYLGDRKLYMRKYINTYCIDEIVDKNSTQGNENLGLQTEGCTTPGNVVSILQLDDDALTKDDCKMLFSEAVNWYESWKKCERGKHTANPKYEKKCLSCLNRFNFNWKDLGSGENKVMKMYGFDKKAINKNQRKNITRMESYEELDRALLLMKYDLSKTLSENKNEMRRL